MCWTPSFHALYLCICACMHVCNIIIYVTLIFHVCYIHITVHVMHVYIIIRALAYVHIHRDTHIYVREYTIWDDVALAVFGERNKCAACIVSHFHLLASVHPAVYIYIYIYIYMYINISVDYKI